MTAPIIPAAVVMTATVTPAELMPGVTRADPGLRLQDYLDAFAFYLGLSDELVGSIILLENSNANLSVFQQLAERRHSKKTVQLLNTTSDYPAEKGKPYCEFLMLTDGLEASMATQTEPAAHFWKVTGRLKVLNLEQMIARAPEHYDIYCDLRSVPLIGEMLGGNRWTDLRLFSFSRLGYKKLLRPSFDLNMVDEYALFHVLKQHLHEDSCRVIPRFNIQPELEGYCGFSNASYRGLGYRMKGSVRKISRAVFPHLWL